MPNSRWFWFVGGRLDYDQFESWETRMNFQGGPGYRILKREDHDLDMTLDAYGGIGARKEWGSANDSWKPEGLLGIDYTYHITERMRLDLDAAYFPTFENISDYRFRSTATWRYALTEGKNLSLVIGYLMEYRAIVDPGKDTTDFRLWIGIQYSFF
jgi:putative salt-induced outer membrane protein YdiY